MKFIAPIVSSLALVASAAVIERAPVVDAPGYYVHDANTGVTEFFPKRDLQNLAARDTASAQWTETKCIDAVGDRGENDRSKNALLDQGFRPSRGVGKNQWFYAFDGRTVSFLCSYGGNVVSEGAFNDAFDAVYRACGNRHGHQEFGKDFYIGHTFRGDHFCAGDFHPSK
ncbi:hypothetical protein BT63DRAFT_426389 [Microthyrium microscopicum]|uniref:Ecp2 effector protein domain-containing protein n=1 Tax=Microthyrium microscopicum TaxID=703497 RepID=A0A6A6U6H1_9PEZI|nr:hypothetical protein BT63DRAFT_426389 [Microthyrium microscopicum]